MGRNNLMRKKVSRKKSHKGRNNIISYNKNRCRNDNANNDTSRPSTTSAMMVDDRIINENNLDSHFTDPNNSQDAGESPGAQVASRGTEKKNSRSPSFSRVEGCRIVDINYLFETLKVISDHGSKFGCRTRNLNIVNEIRHGFESKLILKCNMCNESFSLPLMQPKSDSLDLNTASVYAVTSVGAGFSALEEIFSIMNIPSMTSKTYHKYQERVHDIINETNKKKMIEAAKEEAAYAIANNNVDENGTPLVTVIADGCWSKRSYRTNYSALSGVAAIVGKATGKILYLDVKNKYCLTCSKAKKSGRPTPEHKCYKNHTGSSSSMEGDILVKGFKESLATHGLIYNKLIADGDSSSYKKILEARPYPNCTVEKIECRNHLLRNYCNKLRQLTVDTSYPLECRKTLTPKILRLRVAITKAITHRKLVQDKVQGIQLLRKDILNSIFHVYGEHKECAEYFCVRKEEENVLAEIETMCPSFLEKLKRIVSAIANHARSLIEDIDSNVVEQYNSVVAKFVGGKRINIVSRATYKAACSAACISFNTMKLHTSISKEKFGCSPNFKVKALERRREKMRASSRKYKQTKGTEKIEIAKERRSANADYGEECQKPDMPSEIFEEEKTKFLQSLQKSDEERERFERDTVLQASSGLWLEYRRKLLTASNFHTICKRRPTTSCKNLVISLLYSAKSLNVPSLLHGRQMEPIAKKMLERQENLEIKDCGMFIDDKYPFLGATPDGLVGNKILVEIKCPSSAFGMDINEAVKEKKIRFYKMEKEHLIINVDNPWYYQVQGQLQIAKKDKCIFGIFTGEDKPIKIEIILRDDNFWKRKMEDNLIKFYMDCLLPELVDPRYTRNMDPRDPVYIIDAINKQQNKIVNKKGVKRKLFQN